MLNMIHHTGTPASAVSKKAVAQMGPAGYAPHVLVSNHQGYIGYASRMLFMSSVCVILTSGLQFALHQT
jgi:hypothetical protein